MIKAVHRAPEKKERAGRVAVIVIGWNVRGFLADCLESVCCQTLPADSIVYVDDASTDGSADIADTFAARRVRVIRSDNREGMCAVRMKGVAATESEFVLFVDGDNEIPPDYLATMVSELDRGFDMVYPGKTLFGSGKRYDGRIAHGGNEWHPPEFDRARLWQNNFIDTCSMMRRDTFTAVGGWRQNSMDTRHDWDLALRMSGVGRVVKSKAMLKYRVHDGNWNERERGRNSEQISSELRFGIVSLTVATMWSGRMPGLFVPWLDAVRQSLIAAGKRAELIIVDDSQNGIPAVPCDEVFTAVHVRRVYSGVDAVKRRVDRFSTAQLLSGICNDLLNRCASDVLWIIEDDILVPRFAAADLLRGLVSSGCARGATAGFYRSRHDARRYVGANVEGEKVFFFTELPKAPVEVEFTGTGCLMLLLDIVRAARFAIEWHSGARMEVGHDWAYGARLKSIGHPILMIPSVVCKHHRTELDWV